jgi:hypothetical protein
LGEEFVDLEDLAVRRQLEEKHAALLEAHGMRHLDISQLRSDQRIVTQTIALDLRTEGKPGISYKSNLDGEVCVAVFEGRAQIARYGPHRTIAADDPDLLAAVGPWDLRIEPD